MTSNKVEVIQYLVDTRKLWPAAPKTKDLENEASRALALLTEEERAAVLRYYFVADAKMALASHLLKRWVISRHAGVAWRDARPTRDAKKKPVYVDARTGRQPVAFNVSHQCGIVALVAVAGYDDQGDVNVGVDVVCTSERRARDHRAVEAEGWPAFVDMHADVFGRSEAAYLKADLLGGGGGGGGGGSGAQLARDADIVDAKLRGFYALWCMREAYVKMTGDALLADWLADLEFRRFRAPEPGTRFAQEDGGGQVIREHEIVFKGRLVDDVNLCLRSLGPDYMTCTAVRTPRRKEDGLGWHLGPFEFLELDQVISDAEAASGR
ncbi:phosphopantetheinyl transferase [Xylariaceae sp. FL0662B]|nr:phosphopantetheinyl transferase [Xylariaceae sp. FL0662B]